MVSAFQNGYINYGAGFEEVSYYKHDGRVYLQGLARRDAGVEDGQVIFNLPIGYRPSKTLIFQGLQNTNICRVDINSAGDVRIVVCEASGSFNYISLSGISFRL